MKNPRRIDFTLIFDASDGLWPSVSIFESDITRFFKEKGVDASMVKSIDGMSARYTLFLSKIEGIANLPNASMTQKPLDARQNPINRIRQISPGKQVENIRKQIGRK